MKSNEENLSLEKNFWISKCEKEIECNELNIAFKECTNYKQGQYEFQISEEISKKILKISKNKDLTTYVFVLSALKILFYKYNNIQDSLFIAPVLDSCDEYFNQYVLFRDNINSDKTFKQILLQIKETISMSYKYQAYPVVKLADSFGIDKETLLSNPIIYMDSIHNKYVLENIKAVKNDINIGIINKDNDILLQIICNSSKYSNESIKEFINSFEYILGQILNNIDIVVKDIEVINEEKRNYIVDNYSSGNKSEIKYKTITQLFEETEELYPLNVAVVCGEKQLTYSELNKKSNKLSRKLIEDGVKHGQVVGIKLKRSCDLIVSILAVLKAGAAYLPIDPEYPEERIQYMLKKADCKNVLVNEITDKKININEIKLIDINDEDIDTKDVNNLNIECRTDDVLNIIFTSGSTGKPKGVAVKHESMVNYALWRIKEYGLSEKDIALQLISFSFDGFGSNLYSTILSGGTLVIPIEEKIYDYQYIKEIIKENKVTNISVVPSMYKSILLNIEEGELDTVKTVILAAERADEELIRESKIKNSDLTLVNEYGPTENTVTTTALIGLTEENLFEVGRPIDNHRVYIVNKDGNILPIYSKGEICVCGKGLAKGYVNDEELTASRFVKSNFADNEIIYHTGDIGRWKENKNIELVGRIDNQIKIRGFRIEIEEVEKKINENERIKDAVVICKEDSKQEKFLVAYIMPNDDDIQEEIRSELLEVLPYYMVPSYFIKLDSIPKTKNGKVDRVGLAARDIVIDNYEKKIKPRTSLEKKTAEVWEDILEVNDIGINQDFFSLGGDSIKAIQIVAKLRDKNIKLSVKNLLDNPTIKHSLVYAEYEERKNNNEIISGNVQLTAIQKWFFNHDLKDKNHFNQSIMIHKDGKFNLDYVKGTFDELVKIHDALRMKFIIDEDNIIQENRALEDNLYKLEIVDLTDSLDYKQDIQDKIIQLEKGLDLEKNLIQVGLFKTKYGEELFICIHHLVVDAVSLRILMEDFCDIYKCFEDGNSINIQKTDSYKDWSQALLKYSKSTELLSQTDYWKNIENTEVKAIENYMHTEEDFKKDESFEEVFLDEEETENLLKNINRIYNTEINDILLTALGITIKDWTGNDNVAVELEGHGRDGFISDIDISRTVGWFTTIYPVILDMKQRDDLGFLIKNTKEILRSVPHKGSGYTILKYLTDKKSLDFDFKLKPQIGFNYLGQISNNTSNGDISLSSIRINGDISENFKREHLIDITCLAVDGRFILRIAYNKNMYDEDTMSQLSKAYKDNLINIIKWFMSKENSELTPSDVSNGDLTFEELNYIESMYKGNLERVYDLTPMQEGMLYHTITEKTRDPYIQQMNFDIKGKIDLGVLEETLNKIINKYEIFRTNFIYDNIARHRQIVQKSKKADIKFIDISSKSKEEKEEYINNYLDESVRNRFDLSKDMLMRMSIIKQEELLYKVNLDFHHIIMDGWSIGLLIKEILITYKALSNNEYILEKGNSYEDYIEWLNSRDDSEAGQFWNEYLSEYENVTCIPKKSDIEEDSQFQEGEVVFSIDEDISEKLSNLALKNKVTLSNVIESIWGLLLQRYNDSSDVVFGEVVSGRPAELKGVENIIGLFMNTVPRRIRCKQGQSFIELIKQIQTDSLNAEKYHFYSLAKIQSSSLVKQNLINILFAFENYPVSKEVKGFSKENTLGFSVDNVKAADATNYDFNIVINYSKSINVRIFYNSKIYDDDFIKTIEGHMNNIIKSVVNNPNIKLSDIDILTNKEKDIILSQFNDTFRDFNINETLKDSFEKIAEEFKDKNAILSGDSAITFEELNKKANKIAKVLRNNGLKANDIVGVIGKQSIEMIINIFAVIKAGGAYMPIDYKYPVSRINYMLKDSQAKFLIEDLNIKDSIDFSGIYINSNELQVENEECENLDTINTLDDLIYVIYTSGTTGNPKGVKCSNKGLLNLCNWYREYYGLSDKDNGTKYAGVAFDASVWEIFPQLLSGAAIHIIDEDMKLDINKMNEYYEKNNITISYLPTQVFEQFMRLDNKSLRKLTTGGEKLNYFRKNNYDVVNNYGPTENTVCATSFIVDRKYSNIPIGKPIANNQIYILDSYNRVQPIGVYGEMYLAGDSLAEGYINNEKLTQEKFVNNPFKAGTKMYKTGDRGRFLKDGNIEFIGRKDDQVKIRGYRIELLEIEKQVLSNEEIKECVVTVEKTESGNNNLFAYFVSDKKIDNKAMQKYLRSRLPEYMIPKYFMQLEKMPANRSGKVDKNALKQIEKNFVNEEYTSPVNETESKLLNIWCELLGSSKIGINDNFFEIGGDSILVMKMHSKIKNVFNADIEISDIFANPTINALSQFILNKKNKILVKPMVLSKDYYSSYEEGSNEKFRFEVKESIAYKLRNIAEHKSTNINDILTAIYSYTLSTITGESFVQLQAVKEKYDEVSIIEVDLNKTTEFSELCKSVADKKEDYIISEVSNISLGNKEDSFVPFIYNKNLLTENIDLIDYFDLVLSIDESDSIILTCSHSSKLKSEKVKQIFKTYINLLNAVVQQY